MIWLTPLAWLGLAMVVVPIAVHLIGRRRPRLLAFPTLRFLPETQLTIRPRRRIHDPWLLALRIAIVIAAVAALAGPLLPEVDRRSTAASVARAVIVDTSASMSRQTAGGRLAVADARERAGRLAAEASVSRVIETARLPGGIDDALGWLTLQNGRREIVVISDFQSGAMDASDVARVPSGFGVRVERVPVTPRGRIDAGPIRVNETTFDVTVEPDSAATTVAWSRRDGGAGRLPLQIDASSPAPGGGSWAAIERAAAAGGVPAGAPTRNILVTTAPSGSTHAAMPVLTPQLDDEDRGRVRVAMPTPSALVVVIDPATDALAAARIVRALAHAAVDRSPLAELEPAVVPESVTQSWTREPSASGAVGQDASESDARWAWVVVLILIGAETLVRRRDSDAEAAPAAHEPPTRGRDARVA